jgi:hypothetical protein
MAPCAGISSIVDKTDEKIDLFFANSNSDVDLPDLGAHTRCGL